jgi:hypothetical protein
MTNQKSSHKKLMHEINRFISIQPTVQQTVVCSRPLCTYCGIFSPKKNWFFLNEKFCPQKVEKTSLKSCS